MQANVKTDAHHEGLMFEVQKLRLALSKRRHIC